MYIILQKIAAQQQWVNVNLYLALSMLQFLEDSQGLPINPFYRPILKPLVHLLPSKLTSAITKMAAQQLSG